MQTRKLLPVTLFAIAMAYLEAAVVVYLRQLSGLELTVVAPAAFDPFTGTVEVGRELATVVMLLTLSWAAGQRLQSRMGFFLVSFGVWDIFYYVWLRVLTGWPATLLDRDILFLIPLPWWGPVLAPVLIALGMTALGAWLVRLVDQGKPWRLHPLQWTMMTGGLFIMLYTFMADALAALPTDAETLSMMEPTAFRWPLFLIGLGIGLLALWGKRTQRSGETTSVPTPETEQAHRVHNS